MPQRIRTNDLKPTEMAFFRKYPTVIWPNPRITRSERVPQFAQWPTDPDRCLCWCIKPIFTLCQIIGIVPAQFVHTKEQVFQASSSPPLMLSEQIAYVAVNIGTLEARNDGSTHIYHMEPDDSKSLENSTPPETAHPCQCALSVKFLSVPSLINVIVMAHFITITIWFFINATTILKIYFNGTDLYTFGLQVELLYLQASGILMNALLSRRKLQRVWALIQRVYQDRIYMSKPFF